MKYFLTLIAVFLLLTGTARADGDAYATGMAALKAKDYQTAFDILLPLAESGDSKAQYEIGYMYDRGLGRPEDNQMAVPYFRNAAEQGNPRAQVEMGDYAKWGAGGVEINHQIAFDWYLKAAIQGHPEGYSAMAISYCVGIGVSPDLLTSLGWYALLFETKSGKVTPTDLNGLCDYNHKRDPGSFFLIQKMAEQIRNRYALPTQSF
jgi:TPR repeat protein